MHLIVSVAEHTYLALPRGGVTPKHIQICPIECVPSRVHLSTLAKIEMIKFQEAVESMFHKIGAVSLRYERALRTKGSRDHMQMHMIPLGLDTIQLSKSFTVFLQKASQYKLKFHEIQVGFLIFYSGVWWFILYAAILLSMNAIYNIVLQHTICSTTTIYTI